MPMTWTSAFGRACAVLLRTIVRWLALTRINPNVLTFMGLVVNAWAAFFFGYANSDNQRRMFVYAGLIIIGSGFFDLVDGEVARAQNRVTRVMVNADAGLRFRPVKKACGRGTRPRVRENG